MSNTTTPPASAKEVFNLIKDYFLNSDEKLKAWLLLIGAVLCVIAFVALMALLTWWTAGFWAVLTAKLLTPFLISMGEFSLIVIALVGVTALKDFLIGKLTICWRDWLTEKIRKELLELKKYVELKRFSSLIDNYAQRVQEDIKNFVTLTLRLSESVLRSVLSIGAFTGSLWVIGGALSFTLLGLNIVIPGFLVWVALITALAATIATYFIGKSLSSNSQEVEHAEADFRKDLTQLNHEAENIAKEHAEGYYKSSLEKTQQRVKSTANDKLITQTKLTAFQSFYFSILQVIPYIASAPLYFAGLIEIGQLMQVGMSFGQVSMSLSMIVDSYQNIAECRASINRIVELQSALQCRNLPGGNPQSILIKERDKDTIKVKNLDIQEPEASSTYLMRGLNLKLFPGDRVYLKGKSGIGKSTFFSILARSYGYGSGKVSIPSPQKKQLYFSPQYPTIPHNTLKAVLAYPEPAEDYTDAQYLAALQAVGGMKKYISKLDKIHDWSTLSPGQKQRIAFARVLLKKPDWLFLDEATSALDEESEEHVYNALLNNLTDTTIISIGHRSTIAKFHTRVVEIEVDDETKQVKIHDTRENTIKL